MKLLLCGSNFTRDWYAAFSNQMLSFRSAQDSYGLPHFSGAQYASTAHISMSELQPGDLVYFSNPGDHVAMYIGGGQIIEAPHSGAVVHITAMYSGFSSVSTFASIEVKPNTALVNVPDGVARSAGSA